MPEPIPLPGDLRVVQLSGPDIDPSLAGRWQIERYDARTGRWLRLADRAGGRGRLAFGSEDTAIAFLRGYVRRPRPSG